MFGYSLIFPWSLRRSGALGGAIWEARLCLATIDNASNVISARVLKVQTSSHYSITQSLILITSYRQQSTPTPFPSTQDLLPPSHPIPSMPTSPHQTHPLQSTDHKPHPYQHGLLPKPTPTLTPHLPHRIALSVRDNRILAQRRHLEGLGLLIHNLCLLGASLRFWRGGRLRRERWGW